MCTLCTRAKAFASCCIRKLRPRRGSRPFSCIEASGRDTQVAHEAAALARAKSVCSTCVRPVFVNGDHVVIRWIFEFTWKDGSVGRIEELAYQRWEGEQVVQEQFFYDPKQFVRAAA